MDRVSGEFKRWTQAAAFAIALASAVFFNIDSIRVGEALWEHPAIADQLYSAVQPQSPQSDTASQSVPGGSPNFLADEKKALADIQALLVAGLPIGWPSGHLFDISDGHGDPIYVWTSQTFRPVPGRVAHHRYSPLCSARPFWFDALQSIVRLKGAGPSPADKADKRAASS